MKRSAPLRRGNPELVMLVGLLTWLSRVPPDRERCWWLPRLLTRAAFDDAETRVRFNFQSRARERRLLRRRRRHAA